MQIRRRSSFTSVRTEGAILPPDLLQRVQSGDSDIPGLHPSDFHLQSSERLNEVISRSWNRLQAAWANFQAAARRLPEHDPGTTLTRERFLLPLFQELGYGRLAKAKAINLDGRAYPVSHAWGHVPIHLVGFRIELDRRTPGVAGAARSSPHSMLQDLLNRSDDHLWALLANGLRIRILRDNVSLVRQAYVEFDLEAVFEGEAYADFTLLWLLCHQSRVEGEKAHEFWLERWSQLAQQQGARALDQLREGVEQAIGSLGQGFLNHRANEALRNDLKSGALSGQDYYRQLLRLVYRLIFLFAAEDRELLLMPGAEEGARERYDRYYSTARLRRLAERLRGGRHGDLFEALKLVMGKLNQKGGCPELGLPELGSFLWSEAAIPDLEGCSLENQDLLMAVRNLASTVDGGIRRSVDYRNLGPEELGSVYEALLELQPELNADVGTFELKAVGGSERKTTGSYYTPTSLIRELLDSALEPVVREALKAEKPEDALLDLKVCDPACGSGHFLIAAAHRIAQRLAEVRTGDPEPAPEATRAALRDVISRCIYGVDVNPMAIELCKVNLWLESLDPGRPLSFLDHRIQVGNSLLGATPRLIEAGIPDEAFKPIEGDDKKYASSLKKQNKRERSGQLSMFERLAAERRAAYSTLAASVSELEAIEVTSLEALKQKETQYRRLKESDEYRRARLVADALCAAFFWRKREGAPPAVTEALFRGLADAPEDAPEDVLEEIERLRHRYMLFHWHLAFPDVFSLPGEGDQAENSVTGWSGGFDVVLGNPPWDQIQFDAREYFSARNDEIAATSRKADRDQLIEQLVKKDPSLHADYLAELRKISGIQSFVHSSGRFPLASFGRLNTAPLFTELVRQIIAPKSLAGIIIPSGLVTDSYRQAFFRDLMESRQISSFYEFENEGFFGAGQGHMVRFALLTLAGRAIYPDASEFLFQGQDLIDLRAPDRKYEFTINDLQLFNPNTLTCPIFRMVKDFELNRTIYKRVPILIREDRDREDNPWGMRSILMFMTNVISNELHESSEIAEQELLSGGSQLAGESTEYLPFYEAKMVHQFNHRHGDFALVEDGNRVHILPEVPEELLKDATYAVQPYYWVSKKLVDERLDGIWDHEWLMGWRDVTDSRASARTVVAAIIPRSATNEGFPLLLPEKKHVEHGHLVLGCLNSLVFDYIARQKIGGLHLRYHVMKQLPVPQPASFHQVCPWDPSKKISEWMTTRILELSYTGIDLKGFAEVLSCFGSPYIWDGIRRESLRWELDAAFFHLYLPAKPDGGWQPAHVAEGAVRDETAEEMAELEKHFPTPRHAVDYILDTFPIVKRKDEAKYGEYRTKRVILEIYDEMQQAITTGEPYRTRLDPPPADPRVAHPEEV